MKPEDWIDAKEKPLPDGIPCLILVASGRFLVVQKTANTGYEVEAWMPIVPPPNPDPFETWWLARVNNRAFDSQVKEVARRAWDAALKSKEQSE